MVRPDPPPDLDVEPLTPERFADLAALFSEGGDPKWCWCMFFRVRGLDWSNSTADSNRKHLEGITRSGPPPGLVGYRDDRAVGWVSLGPRESYDRLEHAQLLARVDDTPVWSIVCFVVSRKARRSGVAEALLRAAIDHARQNGATALEAYPIDTGGERIASASAFHGTLSMFKRAGFRVVARRQWNKSSPIRPIVRLKLDRHETADAGGVAAGRKRKKAQKATDTSPKPTKRAKGGELMSRVTRIRSLSACPVGSNRTKFRQATLATADPDAAPASPSATAAGRNRRKARSAGRAPH